MQITFDEKDPDGLRLRSDPEIIIKLRYIKDHLSYQQVYGHYNFHWISAETHQLSCVFHASKRDARGQPYESHPSARYYAHDKQIWCFACTEGGDVAWWIKKWEEHLTYGETLDFIKATFGVGLNNTDLAKRIEMYQKTQEPAEAGRRQILLELYADKVNDEFYRLRGMGKNDPVSVFCQLADRVETEVFAKKRDLEVSTESYLDFSRAVRRWYDWCVDLIRTGLQHHARARR